VSSYQGGLLRGISTKQRILIRLSILGRTSGVYEGLKLYAKIFLNYVLRNIAEEYRFCDRIKPFNAEKL
jgi:hypothetical protein